VDADPRELLAGYAYPKGKGVTVVAGVLRAGRTEVWRCTSQPGHRPHPAPSLAVRCAEAEAERRRQGAQAVLWLAHCVPCGAYWDLGPAGKPGGVCPRCAVPYDRVRVAVLERQEASAR